MENKLCPFCGEEIKYEAVKCKHCGEFLNSTETKNESSRSGIITSQSFNTGIIVAIIYIVLSILISANDDEMSLSSTIKATLYQVIFGVWLWIIFKKYIANFNFRGIGTLIYWCISIEVILGLLSIPMIAYSKMQNNSSGWTNDESFILLITITGIIFMIGHLVVIMMLGNKLIKIKNDFVGYLKPLGISFMITTPLSGFLEISGIIYDANIVSVTAAIIGIIPIILMIMIFAKAKNYVLKTDTEKA